MTTVAQDLGTILTTQVEAAFPGSNSISGYYSATTLLPTAAASLPTPANWYLYAVVRSVLESRPQDQDFAQDQTDDERTALYDDVLTKITKNKVILESLITAVTAIRDAI